MYESVDKIHIDLVLDVLDLGFNNLASFYNLLILKIAEVNQFVQNTVLVQKCVFTENYWTTYDKAKILKKLGRFCS